MINVLTRLFVATGLVLAASVASAQTPDPLFGGWSWRLREPSSRPTGLAGAYVAVADSIRTAPLNPAGLALLPRSEFAAGTAERWAGVGKSLHFGGEAVPTRPTEPAIPVQCTPPQPARPWAVAIYAEQAITQTNPVDVLLGPGRRQTGGLTTSSEEVGLGIAKGLTRWLNVGATFSWRHIRMDGRTTDVDLEGRELGRLVLAGDSNKARLAVGALATFGPTWSPGRYRLGASYRRDIIGWTVERTALDLVRGTVTDPARVRVVEPPVASAGIAWRKSDSWLVAAQLDYIFYDQVPAALDRNSSEDVSAFGLHNGWEPRGAIEYTLSSPTGGYLMVRAGVRRETSGRLAYSGTDTALRQAFRGSPSAFRASVGVSFLAEFYDNAGRLDLDMSQVILEQRSTLSAAGTRRFSIGLTVRM